MKEEEVIINSGHEVEGDRNTNIKTNKNTELGTQKMENVHLGPKKSNKVNGQSGSTDFPSIRNEERRQEEIPETKEETRSTQHHSLIC